MQLIGVSRVRGRRSGLPDLVSLGAEDLAIGPEALEGAGDVGLRDLYKVKPQGRQGVGNQAAVAGDDLLLLLRSQTGHQANNQRG